MVVAQLAKRLPPAPEIRWSNPDNGNNFWIQLRQLFVEKTKINKKEAGNGQLKKILLRLIKNSFELIYQNTLSPGIEMSKSLPEYQIASFIDMEHS